jgi:hypothetical protein
VLGGYPLLFRYAAFVGYARALLYGVVGCKKQEQRLEFPYEL